MAEARSQFIHLWGVTGASWGVSKTLAQVHALLLVSPAALSTEDLMAQLKISRGNASMTVRELLDWGLIYKELRPGDRREFFVAEKDMLQVTRCIIRARKRRELDQMKRRLDQLAAVPGDAADADYKAFHTALADIKQLADVSDKLLSRLMQAERSWFWNTFIKLFV
ncbi:MarR family transcriptional regulator [Hymenobacter sp. M29]|uniref:HTH-type transcriptional regulator n=1 Tax=Hymenobacter mellowenesis TaxID=3063995 RepID=A0ABT9AIR6_9BACT|nr:MarR family transcriptional regulator [Hymenobacter sp. M29]MDO7849758.1 MarR family transcriptional regulator [Hymenobacter sp. M29]